MKIFKEKLKVRWSDLDANMHVANSSYLNFTAAARMNALEEQGIGLHQLHQWMRGPVIFTEKVNYFKEIAPNVSVYVHTQLAGVSEDGILFEFKHSIYGEKGEHHANAYILGCWLDMRTRKKADSLPEEMLKSIMDLKTEHTRILSMEDIKAQGERPINIDPKEL